jgi:hypothetical protein
MFDLQIDKKKLSSMNKSYEKKKPTAHSFRYSFNFLHRQNGSTETQYLRPNWKVVAERAGTNVRK